jgi:hypothetical protein
MRYLSPKQMSSLSKKDTPSLEAIPPSGEAPDECG